MIERGWGEILCLSVKAIEDLYKLKEGVAFIDGATAEGNTDTLWPSGCAGGIEHVRPGRLVGNGCCWHCVAGSFV